MKKSILSIFGCLLVSGAVFSQSFQIISADTLVVEEEVVTLGEAHASIRNTSNNPVRTIVSREMISFHPDHVNYFCWGVNCYGPVTNQSPDTLSVPSQAQNNTFKGYLDADGNQGVSVVRYCFINADNPSDKSCFTARYLMGVTEAKKVEGGSDPSKAVPVPAMYDGYAQTIRINVSGGKIETWNMIGQKVELSFRYDGSSMVADASNLKPGYYFLFGNSESKIWSARVIVTK